MIPFAQPFCNFYAPFFRYYDGDSQYKFGSDCAYITKLF